VIYKYNVLFYSKKTIQKNIGLIVNYDASEIEFYTFAE